jgi:hypothetical protein
LTARRTTLVATAAYVVVAIAMTWPLAAHLTTSLPADLGDPGFNAWVLMWTGGQILAALSGHPAALLDYWNGNIFYPARLTIAYSEHMTPETLQALPFFAATHNILLGYNVVFLGTFVLAGLGMFLLVREWTRQPLAAFLAGLAFAYAPYRIGQLPHLQVLSTQWMPFVLYGLRRYFTTRRPRALAGAGAALVLQNLSCGYYLLFFPPFAAAYALYELAARRLFRDRRVCLSLAATAIGVAILTTPFVLPYFRVREIAPVGVRSIDDIVMFSADTRAFITPPAASRFWAGRLPSSMTSEGEGFPGVTIVAFALVGLAWLVSRRVVHADWRHMPIEIRALTGAAAAAFLVASLVILAIFISGPLTIPFASGTTVLRGIQMPLNIAAVTLIWIVIATTGWRRAADAEPSALGFSALAMVAAAVLSLGPRIESAGHRVAAGPYVWLLKYVPGFDGLRVPARFLMIVAMFSAALAGFGAAWVLKGGRPEGLRLRGCWRVALVVIGMAGILAESFMAPMPMNRPLEAGGLTPLRSLAAGDRIPHIYRVIRDLPEPVVLLELPIGTTRADVPAVYYAGYHRRPIVNGYSGFAPARYERRADLLMRAYDDPPEGLSILEEDGVTHVLVHERAFLDGRGDKLSRWLTDAGAQVVAEDSGDKLFRLR